MTERAVRDADVGDAAVRERHRHPVGHLARADDEHAAAFEPAEMLGRDRDRGRRDRHRVPADLRLGAHALARLDRVPEHAREQVPGGLLLLGREPRAADLSEDLALTDDHRVETRGDREQVRGRGVVDVGVEVIGELVGIGARHLGEEVAHVADRGMEARAACVDLGAVARRQHDGLREVLTRGDVVECLRQPRRRDADPLEHPDRNRPVVETDDDQRHVRSNSFASSIRPDLTRSRMPESNARCQSASSQLGPVARMASRALGEQVEQRCVLGSELGPGPALEPGRERGAPAPRADRDDDVGLAYH